MDQKRLSDGTFAWLEGGGPGPPSYERRTLDGSLIGHLRTVGQETDNHDYLELANGNVMLMSYVDRACVDLTELGLGDCETAIDGYLQEIDPATGALVWEWRSQDHIPVSDTALGAGLRSANDLVHLNSVDEFPDGDLLVSARSAGVYRIDRSTGAVEWKLGGGPSASRLTMIDDPFDGTWRQHDARVLDDDTISVYDNQSGLNRARAVVIDLDEPNDTATLVWEKLLGGGVDSPFIGAHRVQPDGHSVITWGGTLPFFEEVDAAGNRVFALNLNTQFEYRVVKYQPDDFDADQLRAAAGGMVEYDAPTDVIAVAGDREATVSWVAPTIGSPTGYTATASPGGQSCTTTGALSCTVTELNRGQSYVFNVTRGQRPRWQHRFVGLQLRDDRRPARRDDLRTRHRQRDGSRHRRCVRPGLRRRNPIVRGDDHRVRRGLCDRSTWRLLQGRVLSSRVRPGLVGFAAEHVRRRVAASRSGRGHGRRPGTDRCSRHVGGSGDRGGEWCRGSGCVGEGVSVGVVVVRGDDDGC